MTQTFPATNAQPFGSTGCSDPQVAVLRSESEPRKAVSRAGARLTLVSVAGLMLLVGCGGDDGVAACRQRQPAISTGVYGCITASNDVGDSSIKPLPKFSIEVFTTQPPHSPDDGLVPLARTESDAMGFYELNLPGGSYWICTSFRRCVALEQPTSLPIARDYDFGLRPGWGNR